MQQIYRRTPPCLWLISIKLQSNFIEITFRHGCYPVNLLHIFRTPFQKNTSGWLLLNAYNLTQLTHPYTQKMHLLFSSILVAYEK